MVLVRHGQSIPFTEGEPFPLVDGHGDPPLSPRGMFQAELVGQRLADEPISAIYVSTLTRTHQTAAPLAARLGLGVAVEPDLREVFLGDWEGGEFRRRSADGHPAALRMRERLEWSEAPGAESNAELTARTSAALTRITLAHPDEMVAVFCHGGVIASIMGFVTGLNPFTFGGVRNGSLTYLYATDDRWFIRAFNDAAHIGGLGFDSDPI